MLRVSVAVVLVTVAHGVGGVRSAHAAVNCEDADLPTANEDEYSVDFGKVLKIAPEPDPKNLLANDTGDPDHPIRVDVSGSDTESFWGDADIKYGTGPNTPNVKGAFIYTPDPGTPFSGIDEFDYGIVDTCGEDDSSTAYVTVRPIVKPDVYATPADTTLVVGAGNGVLANDLGFDPLTLDLPTTSGAGGIVDDAGAGDGSFTYEPPPGFLGVDSFEYDVDDLNGDETYTGTATLNVGSAAARPAKPTNVKATKQSVSNRTASVSWKAAANHGSAITKYTVTASPGGKKVVVGGNTTKATVTGLSTGTGYTFKVKATNAFGTGPNSNASNKITFVKKSGYWMLGSDGHIFAFGDAGDSGDNPGPAVAVASRADGKGYWVTNAAGRVRSFGSASHYGGGPPLNWGEWVTTIAAHPGNKGYWLFTNRGRAFAYGAAKWYGDMRGTPLNGEIVASTSTANGKGYYMVGTDGGIFTFGNAKFHGSTGGIRLNKPVVGISPTPDGKGYWLVATDGGVFAFKAPFRGSMGGRRLNKAVNGLIAFGNGYLMVASDGGVFNFSNQAFAGSLGANPPPAPIVGIAAFALVT